MAALWDLNGTHFLQLGHLASGSSRSIAIQVETRKGMKNCRYSGFHYVPPSKDPITILAWRIVDLEEIDWVQERADRRADWCPWGKESAGRLWKKPERSLCFSESSWNGQRSRLALGILWLFGFEWPLLSRRPFYRGNWEDGSTLLLRKDRRNKSCPNWSSGW